jgi:hypothetical protein
MRFRLRIALVALGASLASPSLSAPDEVATTEDLVRCSDLVVLATVAETVHDGVVAGDNAMIHTRHILKVSDYYVGSGPQEITVLTPGGFEHHPDGRETYTSVVAEGMVGVRPGQTFLAFLQVFPPGFKFVNRRGSQVEPGDVSGHQTVSLRFGKVALLSSSAQHRYEQLREELAKAPEAQRDRAKAKFASALTEAVPVTDLAARLKLVLTEVGGPKSANTTCY